MEVKNSQRKPKKKHHSSKKIEKTDKTLRKKKSGKNLQQSGRRKKPKSQHQTQTHQGRTQQSSRNCVNESRMRSTSYYSSNSEYNTSKSQLNSTHREAEGGMAIRLAPSTTVEDDPEANKVADNFYFCPSKQGTPRNVSDYNNEADENPGPLEVRTPEVRTPRARTPSTAHARNPNEGRQIRLAQSVPDDDEVNKLVEKYKPRRSIMLAVQRPSILVDQMVRSRMSTPMLSEPATDKTLANTQNIEFEDIPEMKTAMLGKQRTPPIETATARLCVIEEDSYDNYPKLGEVLHKPPDIVYGLNELPNWMDYLEPTDDDMLNVEPTCSVGSEQIEMYHQKKFQLKYPPSKKITLDQYQPSMVLADRDNVLFTPQLIFSNTIRSLINVAAAKKEKQKSDDDLTQNLSEEVTLKHIDLDRTHCYTYVRSDPIRSMAKKMLMNTEDIPRREDLLLFPKR